MANYNGARRKTAAGNRNAYSQSSETGAKSKKYFTENSGGGDGWGNNDRRPSRSTSYDGWGDGDRRKYSKDDGWGEINRRPSNYTSDDLWAPLPSQTAVQENAWDKRGSKRNQKSHTNQGKKPVPLVGPNFSWDDEGEYPALESRQPPVENVWEKRKNKLEGRKAMEPTNQTEEELMIQKAIELSKREAMEEEERRRLIEEEYALQNVILASNPQSFSEFLTPDELAEANKSSEPEGTGYNDFPDAYVEKESVWDYQEPVETQQPQKQSKKSGRRKKTNKSESSTHMEDEISNQNAWSDNQKTDHNKQNESTLPEQIEYQEIQDNWSQNSVNKNYCNATEENESQFADEGSDYPSAELKSTASPNADDESKMHKDSKPKISKVIDMFGGWGSKNTQKSSVKSSHTQERLESYDDFSSVNSVSNDKEIFQDDWENSKEMSKIDENLRFPKSSTKHSKDVNSSVNEKDQSSLYEEDSWNSKSSSNNKQHNNEFKHSLYSHVENNIAASASSSFCNAATNSSDTGTSYLSKKSVSKDDDIMNSIVQDYASLAVNCTDSSPKENVPVQRKSKDIFSSGATLLNEENLKPDLPHSSVGEPQNGSIPVANQTSKREIMYSLNKPAPAEFSNNAPNENIAGSWNDSKIGFPTNAESNEMNDSLFLPHNNESVKDVLNDHEGNPVDPVIPAPVQCETHFPGQPNPVMPNLMNPNFMMGMNPLMMQQMMMLNNPFFLQQLHQMEMYYRAMSMPFNLPLIPPLAMPTFNPMLNNPMGNFLNDESNINMNPVPEQSAESNQSIPPPCHTFEDENQRSMPINSDAPQTSAVPNVEFENSWLSGLLSEGAAHMDSYIPPPTVPATNPPENPHPAPSVENKVDMNIAQNVLHSAYGNETINLNSNCNTKSLKQESSTLNHGRTETVNANARNVNSNNTPKPSVPDTVEASGWGEIDDIPKKTYASWNDDVDGWSDEKVTTSKSMINSSRYASSKQATTRQPIRQPRQTSQWR
ncbi:hypothetical protein AVEN_101183-1 [Araneus ventricosus]|uniref:Uncharacterized protein n=1 Tax=Araneus ventricosus TaxID=182803 RepID=A0A4Y2DEQ3_ARAVE|nr:hypothetical protein AVEN_101183-1 [Araneus ventricosus]